MKKRTAIIGALVSLLPLGQPWVIGTSAVLTSAGMIFAIPDKAQAESAEFYFKRAFKKENAGDYAGAILDYTKAIEEYTMSKENLASAYGNRGMAKDNNGDTYGAISDLNKAIKIDPTMLKYRSRGIAKWKIRDMKGACADWRETASLSPNDAAAQWVRNQC